MKHMLIVCACIVGTTLFAPCQAQTSGTIVTAQPSSSVSLALYDAGIAVVNERRVVHLTDGNNRVLIGGLPEKMDMASMVIQPQRGSGDIDVRQLIYLPHVRDAYSALTAAQNQQIIVQTDKGKVEGTLVSTSPENAAQDWSLLIQNERGVMTLLPSYHQLIAVVLPDAAKYIQPQPAVLLDLMARTRELSALRIQYITRGMQWRARYELIMNSEATQARIRGRAEITNHSGADFQRAGIRLIATDRGMDMYMREWEQQALSQREKQTAAHYRYQYGEKDLRLQTALTALAPVFEYTINDTIDLTQDSTRYIDFCSSDRVPVQRRYVYDGVVFDRFERNRRNDWSYGTKFEKNVDMYVEFGVNAQADLGIDLAPGWLHLYEEDDNEGVELIAEELFMGAREHTTATLRVGQARGISGERERTWYSEVIPLHEYDESFEIRLQNDTKDDVEVTVLEHLYRWPVFEIEKADAEYTMLDDDTMSFKVLIPANGRKLIHYTVRYRW